jgi:uncharacterized metal-binding protein YceD (DUF177 family)
MPISSWKMSGLSKYNIDIINLKNQEYQYEFRIDPSFFSQFEESEIKKGSLSCFIVLRKTESFIETIFHIQGKVELECDRSLEKFDHSIDLNRRMVFKYGDEDKEIDDEVELISRNRQGIEMSQFIYEFISMGIPMKKLHPKYNNEHQDNDEQLFYSSIVDGSQPENHEEEIDPRWETLKKLKKIK